MQAGCGVWLAGRFGDDASEAALGAALESAVARVLPAVPRAEGGVVLMGVSPRSHAEALAALGSPRGSGLPGVSAPAVLVVASGLARTQLQALLDAGAADFIQTPFADDELALRVARLAGPVAGTAAVVTQAAIELPTGAHPRIRDFIGSSPAFLRQVARLPTFAGCDAGVLILGETGTGKEVCAQAIHYLSARASRPWVAVNCGALPTELIENELFGHVKGAYTTASSGRAGLVREAEGGTLFLDDIDCLPQAAQAKLLRFLQEGEYRPVGCNAVRRADVRVIAASNHRLPELVAAGAFRQDLYFRLNVLTLTLPSLRERRDDIAALALFFVRRFAAQFKRPVAALSPAALARLLQHDWPGNVRELRHVIERAVLLAGTTTLGADDIDLGESAGGIEAPAGAEGSFRAAKARVVENFERSFIESLLALHGGNVTHAALAAGKNRRAFFELMRKHRIEAERFRAGLA
jgi:two-component system response regulator GlrR